MDNSTFILGQGISFPFILVDGAVKVDQHPTLIDQSIRTILCWGFGNRWFNPTFGSKLEELLGEPNDVVVAALARFFVVDAISNWEQRITLLAAVITMPTPAKLHLQLHYRVNATRDIQEFNFQYQL
jgi:phage baseplate assembly protein W